MPNGYEIMEDKDGLKAEVESIKTAIFSEKVLEMLKFPEGVTLRWIEVKEYKRQVVARIKVNETDIHLGELEEMFDSDCVYITVGYIAWIDTSNNDDDEDEDDDSNEEENIRFLYSEGDEDENDNKEIKVPVELIKSIMSRQNK